MRVTYEMQRSCMDTMLTSTCVPSNVALDMKNMKAEYEDIILPFLHAHKEHFR